MRPNDKDRPAVTGGRAPAGRWIWPATGILGSIDQPVRDRLLTLGALTHYESDRVVIREGDQSTFVLIMLDGVVKATGRAQDARDALLAIRVGGDLVGELGVMDGRPRSATITTCGPVIARLVTRDEFLACVRDDAPVSAAVNRSIIGKLRSANTRRIDFAGSDAGTRVARVLYDIAVNYGTRDADGVVTVGWPLTQPELATLVGAAEPTVHKALRDLRVSGAVSTGYRRFRVDDLERLRSVAFPDPD